MNWIDRIGRRLQPRDLHIFLAVSESGSMAKAAERLACSRPVVSKSIAQLEGTLGVQLFDRTLKGIEHTRYGLALLRRSTSLFDELRQAVNEIDQLLDPNAGELRIGCIETMMAGLGAAAIDRLLRKYPRLRVQTFTGAAPAQLQWLRERKCEIVLGREVADEADPEINAEVLYHERLLVVAGASTKLVRRPRVSLADVTDEKWILAQHEAQPGGPGFEAFVGLGLPLPNISVVSDSLALRYGLVATGQFLTMVPASVFMLGWKPSNLRVLPIEIRRSRKPRILATLKGRTLSPAAAAFIDQVRTLAEPLIERKDERPWQAVAPVHTRGSKPSRSDLRTHARVRR
jgi:DNA-binding transcriptional LysR family regulator